MTRISPYCKPARRQAGNVDASRNELPGQLFRFQQQNGQR
ncbi:hypothetical protein Msip34_2567 [Methylovorus glucosotrophus SIP3-4]|uniref:Uncharacterized protein n=1 Tax=Methylovorus glucosotrophus (strain SIP3-4) TaxID=582744 RepID=C6XB34_METGS|nr:hypothetical protein Msip34_2567 [Methylovorus glucosotrophus SIP3-4]